MKLNKQGIIDRDPGALKELQRIVRHCARIGAARAGAQSIIDDVEQEVVMLVLERLIFIYDERRDVEPFLIDTCRRIALGLHRAHIREVIFSQAGDDEGSSDWHNSIADTDGIEPDRFVSEREDERRVNNLVSKMAKAIGNTDPPPSSPDDVVAGVVDDFDFIETHIGKAAKKEARKRASDWAKPKRGNPIKSTRPVSPEGVEIRSIRTTLRYTHQEMASALGVDQHVVRNIEYGFTVECPPPMLEKARLMLEKHRADLDVLTMAAPDLVNSWCTRLGMQPDDYSGLSMLIGTNRSTTFRWLKGEGSPTPSRIRTVEAIVQIEEKRRERMAEAGRGA